MDQMNHSQRTEFVCGELEADSCFHLNQHPGRISHLLSFFIKRGLWRGRGTQVESTCHPVPGLVVENRFAEVGRFMMAPLGGSLSLATARPSLGTPPSLVTWQWVLSPVWDFQNIPKQKGKLQPEAQQMALFPLTCPSPQEEPGWEGTCLLGVPRCVAVLGSASIPQQDKELRDTPCSRARLQQVQPLYGSCLCCQQRSEI